MIARLISELTSAWLTQVCRSLNIVGHLNDMTNVCLHAETCLVWSSSSFSLACNTVWVLEKAYCSQSTLPDDNLFGHQLALPKRIDLNMKPRSLSSSCREHEHSSETHRPEHARGKTIWTIYVESKSWTSLMCKASPDIHHTEDEANHGRKWA